MEQLQGKWGQYLRWLLLFHALSPASRRERERMIGQMADRSGLELPGNAYGQKNTRRRCCLLRAEGIFLWLFVEVGIALI